MCVPRSNPRTRRAASAVGLCLARAQTDHAAIIEGLRPAARALARWLCEPGDADGRVRVALITGPSGSGKSTLLRLVRRELACEGAARPRVSTLQPDARLARGRLAVASMDAGPLDRWLAHLARLGLGEARLWLAPASVLSAGQRFRLALALATRPKVSVRAGARDVAQSGWQQAPRVLIADEFAATLDRFTAKALCLGVGQIRSADPLSLLLATSHDDLHAALRPGLLVTVGLDGRAAVQAPRADAC